jgi:sulfatase-like protein
MSESGISTNDVDSVPGKADHWPRFVEQVVQDLRLVTVCMAALTVFRGILIGTFHSQMSPDIGGGDLLLAMLNGMRFDLRITALVVAPSLTLSLACLWVDATRAARRVRWATLTLFLVVTLVVGLIDIVYFGEYHDQFNHWVLGVVFDDLGAVLETAWKQYPIVWGALGLGVAAMILVYGAGLWVMRRAEKPGLLERITRAQSTRVLALLLLVIFYVCAVRGSASNRSLQEKDAAVTRDTILNRTVVNPYTALRYAVKNYLHLTSAAGLDVYLPDGDIRAAARLVAGDDRKIRTIDDALRHTAAGPKGTPPRHIFLLVMESYDAWPTLKRYEPLGLSANIKRLGGQGVLVRAFLPASTGTMASFSPIITGLADPGVMINYQPTARRPYATSIAPIFKSLGYETNVFYSGYPSWQRIGDFCIDQGFDNVYSGADMGSWVDSNEWGVDDEDLLNYVVKNLDDDRPSFNLILTTTFHPPYDIRVYDKGFPLREVPAPLRKKFADTNISLPELGHLWYSDQCVGRFAKQVTEKFKDPIIAATGDHWSRRFIGARPSLYERSAVPLMLYGPSVLDGIQYPEAMAGSHLDICPTLIELAAPRGFEYHAMGRDMLAPRRHPLGFGRVRVIGPDFIMDTDGRHVFKRIPGRALPSPRPDRNELLRRHSAVQALAWWRIMQGTELPDED